MRFFCNGLIRMLRDQESLSRLDEKPLANAENG